jgi:S-DNA-T family DNA segregation ATPase FtsK/SpoIIIE
MRNGKARSSRRGAVLASAPPERRLGGEVGAIAVVAFALLSLVALVTDQGALLHWWRGVLVGTLGAGAALVPPALALGAAAFWWPGLRTRLVMPFIGGTLAVVALLSILEVAFADPLATGPGGALGQTVGRGLEGPFGTWGSIVALLALFVVGVVLAAERSIAELIAPLVRRRPSLVLRPGASLPSGTFAPVARDERPTTDDELEEHELRINLPGEPRDEVPPARRGRTGEVTAPLGAAAAVPAKPIASGSAPAASRVALGGSTDPMLAGLPSAAVAAEGVLHAEARERPWTLPRVELLDEGSAARSGRDEVVRNKRVIEETLAHFGIAAKVEEINVGPVVTRYELKPAPGVKLSRIEALADDLALALAARTLRIEAPIPGKSAVGIEIPNMAIGLVSLRDVAESADFRGSPSKLTVALGKDVAGQSIVTDLTKLPHLLIAGQTGSGKSVCISSILCSLLLEATPDDIRILIGDLKRVDFPGFNGVPHLVVPVMHEPQQILNALYWTTGEMDRRYRLFARASARNIAAYNEKHTGVDRVPYVVFIIDELADLMLQAPIQVEKQITRVAQLARATGIHLVLGTQRPSVDVITGLIKANIPARIAFATASAVDSRTILDMTGAEKLLGRGDMLWLAPDSPKPVRAQGVYVSDKEIDLVTRHWKQQGEATYHMEIVRDEERVRAREDDGDEMDDDRYDEAVDIVQTAGQASVSMLQRKMTIGFARAGRLIDIMERRGVIGPSQGPGKMRDVYGVAPRGGDE